MRLHADITNSVIELGLFVMKLLSGLRALPTKHHLLSSGVRFTELELLLMRFKFNCNLKLGVGFTKFELLVYNEVGTSTSFLTVGASPHIGPNPTYAVTAAMPQMSLDCTSYWM